ncbi:MAG: leucine--tRNA ligase [Bacteroidota bacterium]|nr:leucine--tRNA ligase [Bacteroidota bacterium]
MKYNFTEIEKKWQKYWDENKTFKTPDINELDKSKPKYYVLDMLPYTSGDGLHVGHPEGYTATDIIARFKRMKGFNVMHPIGWDAFGLPTEQYAIKTGIHPKIRTAESVDRFKSQLKSLGFSYDWDREIDTSDENYFKWTQWIFLKIFNSYYDEAEDKAKPISELKIPEGLSGKEKYDFINSQRLAYLAEVPVNWSPELGTVLSNEEVPEQIEKGFTVIKKNMRQWNLRITKYAERLLMDLDKLEWPNNVKEIQRNWIGKSQGAVIKFKIKDFKNADEFIEVFTTRPDTIFGATYIILSPEHSLVKKITTDENSHKVKSYIETAAQKSDMERTELSKEKTGVSTGSFAINPVNGKEIPVLIADYVLASYGTGAIMGVPGHDERDNEFAIKFKLRITPVVVPSNYKEDEVNKFLEQTKKGEECFSGEGYSINSDFLNGLTSLEATKKIIQWLEEKGIGRKTIRYKLRDWLFSRQRFWGEPFPIVHFEDGTFKALDESELPLTLPDAKSYKSSGTGESPLANIEDWVNTIDKETKRKARRETHTMPQWAGSCWYYLRYLDPFNEKEFFDKEKEKFWMPIDLYIGGAEHSVLHLIYARFWYKILYDLGYVSYEEPFGKLYNQGTILGEDGVKMSKSRGNVINPDDVIRDFGADSMRLFEMFMGPLDATKPWSTKGIEGLNRFLSRVWRLIIDENSGEIRSNILDEEPEEKLNKLLHKTIKKVTEDIDDGDMKFNTAISYLMILVNELYKLDKISKKVLEKLILLLSPFAPHIGEELWEKLGNKNSIQFMPWPDYDESLVKDHTVTVVFQVNGKIRSKHDFDFDSEIKVLEDKALDNENVKKYTLGKEIVKIITVKNKMVNIVVK